MKCLRDWVRLILRLFVALAALVFVSECVLKFLSAEIGTQISFVDSGQTAFPALALCFKHGYKQSEVRKHGFSSIFQMLQSKSRGGFNGSVSELMARTRFELHEFLESLEIKTREAVDNEYSHVLYHVLHRSNASLHFQKRAERKQGLCHVANLPERFSSASISELRLTFFSDPQFSMTFGIDFRERGWELLLHSRGQMHLSTARVHTRQRFNMAFRVEHELFLRSQHCQTQMNENLDTCLDNHASQITLEKEKCLFPWNNSKDNSTPICETPEHYDSNRISRLASEIADSSREICGLPCQQMDFNVVPLSEIRQDSDSVVAGKQGFLVLYFDSEIEVIKEFSTYGLLSMVGEASGYLGLFLGISCYQIIGIIFPDQLENAENASKSGKKVENKANSKEKRGQNQLGVNMDKVFVVRRLKTSADGHF